MLEIDAPTGTTLIYPSSPDTPDNVRKVLAVGGLVAVTEPLDPRAGVGVLRGGPVPVSSCVEPTYRTRIGATARLAAATRVVIVSVAEDV